MTTVENNNTVSVHYTGTLDDGTEFDSSRNREPFIFKTGTGQVVPGFNDAVVGMNVGETKTVTLTPEQAYGPTNENAYQVVPKNRFGPDFTFEKNQPVAGNNNGQEFRAVIEAVLDNHVVLNFNHPLAGQNLTFEIEVLSIEETK